MTPAVQCCVGHSMGSASIHWLPDLAEINDQWDTMYNFVLREALLIVAVSASRVFRFAFVFLGFFSPLWDAYLGSNHCWSNTFNANIKFKIKLLADTKLYVFYLLQIAATQIFLHFFFETLQNTKHNLHRLSLNNSYWTLARDSLRFAPSYNSYLTRITQDYLPTECNNIKLMRWLQAKEIAITVRDCSKDQKPKSHQETFSTEKRMRCKQSEIKMPVMPSININLQANDNDVFLAVPWSI